MADTEHVNRLSRALAKLEPLPAALRKHALSLIMGRLVRFVGTAGLDIEELTPARAIVAVRSRAKVHNHISGVHAGAMALIAETATGFLVAMNTPDTVVPVIKSMHIEFVQRATGSLRAVAELSEEQRHLIRTTPKGDVIPKIIVTDDAGKEPIRCTMVWAWTPKRK